MKKILSFTLLLLSLNSIAQVDELDELFQKLENTKSNTSRVDILLKITKRYYDYNNFKKASIYLHKSDSISRKAGYNDGKAKTAFYNGLIYKKNRNYINAKNQLINALRYVGQNKYLESDILTELGGVHIKMKDYDAAADYLVDAIQLHRELKNSASLVTALNYFGDLNLAYGRVKTVAAQLEEARKIGQDANSEKELLQNYLLMRKLEDKLGNTEAAREWMNTYKSLKNSLKDPAIAANGESNLSDTNPYIIDDFSIVDSLDAKPIKIIEVEDTLSSTNKNKKNNLKKRETDSEKIEKLQNFTYLLFGLITALALTILFLVKRNNKLLTGEATTTNKKRSKDVEELIERNMYLEKEIDVKNRLFSIISHDLKDALTSTKGFIDLIKDGNITDDEFKTLIPEVSNNADNASLLILNLLNWSKSQMKSLDAKGGMFDIKDLFTEKIKLLESRINHKNIRIQNNTIQDFVYADKNMIEIVIQNLLANAIKFSKPGDKITIENSIKDGKCLFKIEDTGIGISPENLKKLFNNINFTTIGTENEKGNGLGLSICKEMVELNNGEIWVESEINKGTTFFVELPKSK